MNITITDFPIDEILNANKKNLEKTFFRLRIKDTEYLIHMNRLGIKQTYIRAYTKKNYINEKNPIEHAIYKYEQELINYKEKNKFRLLSFELNHPPYPTLNSILERKSFSITAFNNTENNYLNQLLNNNELTELLSKRYTFKNFGKTILKFEKKFNEQIYNLCIKCIENSEYLQEKLIKIHESKINEQKEIEEYMQKIKEKEKKKIEFNKNLRNTKSKNSNDFNIHW